MIVEQDDSEILNKIQLLTIDYLRINGIGFEQAYNESVEVLNVVKSKNAKGSQQPTVA